MIHEIGIELQAKLAAKGCPFRVVDREAFKPTAHRNIIVLEHTGDTYGPAQSQSRNPKIYYTRNIGVKLTLYAQSTRAGAAEFEHRRVAETALDMVLIALRTIHAERKAGIAALNIGAGKFIALEDAAKSERQGGAVYELALTFGRGVADLTWAGAGFTEFEITPGFVTSSTSVSGSHVPEDDDDPNTPVTACGA